MPKTAHQTGQRGPAKPYGRRDEGQSSTSASSRPRPARPRPDRMGQSDRQEQQKQRPQRPGPRAPPKSADKAPKPQQLDLSGQRLTAPPSFADFTALSKLNLSKCGLTSISFVKQVAGTLTWLNVTGNDLSGPGAWDGVETLSTLFVMNASHCSLTETPRCVASLKSLKALVLSHNSLTKLEHVANLPDLNTIVVSNNSLPALPKSLATLPSLKKISAAHNQLSSAGLPDLSALPHLHELRLNDNRPLSSLPAHFGSWGKAPLPPSETASSTSYDPSRPRKGGLEILDLGNCGFESWFGLRELVKQDGIVNFGLKGNKVAEEAIAANGADGFREKLQILLPSLRILDTHRFDAKHAELKAARSSRTAEQKILDAGPMALALNAKSEAPVEVTELLKARERERENKRRRKKGIAEEVGEGKKRRRDQEEAGDTAAAHDNPSAGPVVDKRSKRARAAVEGDDSEAIDAEASEAASDKPKKPKKRTKAERKALAKAREAEVTTDSPSSAPTAEPAGLRKGGALDALKDDGSAAPRPATTPASAPPPAPAESRPEEKQKTSVAKIIEVRKPDGGKKKSKKSKAAAAEGERAAVDVGALLGLAPAQPTTTDSTAIDAGEPGAPTVDATAVAKQDPLASLGSGSGNAWGTTGSGLFGGGGWN